MRAVFYLIGVLSASISGCGGGSSSPTPAPSVTPTTTPTPAPTSGVAVVTCASGKLCPPSNISVVNSK